MMAAIEILDLCQFMLRFATTFQLIQNVMLLSSRAHFQSC